METINDRRPESVCSVVVRAKLSKELSKMVSENVFANIYDCIPFLFPKIRSENEKESTLIAIVFVVLETATCVTLVPSLLKRIHSNTSDMSNFVETFNSFYYLLSSALNVFFHLKPMYRSYIFLEDILKFEKSFGVEKSNEFDSFLFLILLIISTTTFALLWFVPLMKDLYALNLLLNIYFTFQVVGMKHMISKRVKMVVDKLLEEKEEETFGLFLSLRTILSYNTTVNKTNTFRIANGMGNGISTLLASLCAYWRVYGLRYPYDCYERNNPYLTPFVHGTAVFEMLFLATPARQLSDSVSYLEVSILCSSLVFYFFQPVSYTTI